MANWFRQHSSLTDPLAWAFAILAFLAVLLAAVLAFDWSAAP
jgi:hypothetical protein